MHSSSNFSYPTTMHTLKHTNLHDLHDLQTPSHPS